MFYETDEDFDKYVPFLQKSDIDGLILGGVQHANLIERLRKIREQGLPTVTVHEYTLEPSIPNVGVDQALMSEMAANYFAGSRTAKTVAHGRARRRTAPRIYQGVPGPPRSSGRQGLHLLPQRRL